MANQFVSQTATNGYVIGNDSNDGTTRATAVLTLETALLNALGGESITINNGTYRPPASPGYFTVGRSQTISAENPLQVTIAPDPASTIRLINTSSSAGLSAVFNDIVIDGEDFVSALLYLNNNTATLSSWTFNSCELKNNTLHTFNAVGSNSRVKLNLNNCSYSGTVLRRGFIYMPSTIEGGIEIDGLAYSQSGRNNSQGGVVFIIATGPGVTASVKNLVGTCALQATATGNDHKGVLIHNIPNALIEDCNLDITGIGNGSAAASLYEIAANQTNIQDSSNGIIRRCSGTNGTTAGKTAIIGSDSDVAATNNQHNYGQILDCNLNGSVNSNDIHGPALIHGIGGRIQGCTMDLCGIGGAGLLKAMVNDASALGVAIAAGNTATRSFRSYLYQKGCVGSVHANNTVTLSSGYPGIVELVTYDDTSSPALQGSAGVFANNIVQGGDIPTLLFQEGTPGQTLDTSSGTVIYISSYDIDMGGLSNLWRQGNSTIYATIADFNTAHAAVGFDAVQVSIDLVNNIPATGGNQVSGGYSGYWGNKARPYGNNLEPFSDSLTSIGATQSTLDPGHPANL